MSVISIISGIECEKTNPQITQKKMVAFHETFLKYRQFNGDNATSNSIAFAACCIEVVHRELYMVLRKYKNAIRKCVIP